MRLRTCCTWVVVLASAATMERASFAQAAAPGAENPAPAAGAPPMAPPAASASAPPATAPAAPPPAAAAAPAAPEATAPPATPFAPAAPAAAPAPPGPFDGIAQTESPPFSMDFGWINGTSRQKKPVIDTPFFTGEFLVDTNYT
ncbi:MAG: hypothetical protein ACLP1X_32795, partial [Polyangiaceae bacterium]